MGFGIHTGAVANPRGRPKKGTRITDHLLDLLAQSEQNFSELKAYLEKREKTRRLGKITMARLLAARMIVQAYEGNAEIMKEILNRVEGKVRDELQLSQAPRIQLLTNIQVLLPVNSESTQEQVKVLPEQIELKSHEPVVSEEPHGALSGLTSAE